MADGMAAPYCTARWPTASPRSTSVAGRPTGWASRRSSLLVDPRDARALAHRQRGARRSSPLESPHGRFAPDTYEAEIELKSPVSEDAGEAVGHLRRAARRRCARPARAAIGAGIHPAAAFGDVVHVAERALRARSSRCCAGSSRARRPPRRTSTSGCPTPRRRSSPTTACAGTCRCCRRSRELAVLVRHRLGLRLRPRAAVPRLPALGDPAARSAASTTTRGRSRRSSPAPRSPTTRSCGGTCGRTRCSAPSRSARWTRSPTCARSPALAALVHGLALHEVASPRTGRATAACSWSRASAPRATACARRSGSTARCARCPRSRAARVALARRHADAPSSRRSSASSREGNGADRQRAVHARDGMPGLLRHLARGDASPCERAVPRLSRRRRCGRRSGSSCRSRRRRRAGRAGSRGRR